MPLTSEQKSIIMDFKLCLDQLDEKLEHAEFSMKPEDAENVARDTFELMYEYTKPLTKYMHRFCRALRWNMDTSLAHEKDFEHFRDSVFATASSCATLRGHLFGKELLREIGKDSQGQFIYAFDLPDDKVESMKDKLKDEGGETT